MVIIQIPGFKINRLESELKEHLPLITTATITRQNEVTNSSARLALIITHTQNKQGNWLYFIRDILAPSYFIKWCGQNQHWQIVIVTRPIRPTTNDACACPLKGKKKDRYTVL